ATDATLRLRVDGAPAGERRVALAQGTNEVPLGTSLRGVGLHRLSAEVAAEGAAAELAQPIVVKEAARILVLEDREDEAQALVVDRSGSMSLRTDNVSKMAMAREAAVLATESLRPDDQLGVLAFDIRNDWVVPLGTIAASGGIGAVQQAINRIEADGGTD